MKKFKAYLLRFMILMIGLLFFFYFGLAHIFWPDKVLEFFNVPYFQPLAFMKIIGAAGLAFATAMFYVFINPGKNRGIVASVLVFSAAAAVILAFSIIRGELPVLQWFNVGLLLSCFFVFLFSYGKV